MGEHRNGVALAPSIAVKGVKHLLPLLLLPNYGMCYAWGDLSGGESQC
jgi:hypothetical protein